MRNIKVALLGIGIAASLSAGSGGAETNLLVNGDFRARNEAGLPNNWIVVKGQKVSLDDREKPPGIRQSLRVDVVADGGSSYGQIYQTVKARPDTVYWLEGQLRSSKAGLGLLSVKLLKGGREVKRLGSAKSPGEWKTVTLEFSTEDADEIQVLCRWEQNAARGWVGQTCWFADLKLRSKGAAPPPPAWTIAIKQAALIQPVAPPPLPLPPAEGDLFVTPAGAGKRDGTSWDNALPGNGPGVIQAAWDALAPGHACRLGSGVYARTALNITSGGTGPDKVKRLAGEDTGGGYPWLVGSWDPKAPDKGPTLLNLTEGVSYCAFEHLQLARYQYGIFTRKGRHVGLRIRDFDVHESRYGLFLPGLAYADEPAAASHDLVIEDCDFIHFTKSGIRLQGGNYDVRIINCVADAGGVDWMKESFQICFNVAGDSPRRLSRREEKPWAGEHDILFINCVARNAIWSKDRYWQGDGFLAENDVRNMAFINCVALDNADGGWDNKATNVVYVNCAGLRNKMNFRVWQQGFFYHCLSAYAFKRGGSWTGSGLWTLGDTRVVRGTFHNNETRNLCADSKPQGEDGRESARNGSVTLERCLISFDGENSQTEELYAGEDNIRRRECAEWAPRTAERAGLGTNPEYVGAHLGRSWAGQPADAFDSRLWGPGKGFHSGTHAAWAKKTPEQLVEAARVLLKNRGWEDFKETVERLERQAR